MILEQIQGLEAMNDGDSNDFDDEGSDKPSEEWRSAAAHGTFE